MPKGDSDPTSNKAVHSSPQPGERQFKKLFDELCGEISESRRLPRKTRTAALTQTIRTPRLRFLSSTWAQTRSRPRNYPSSRASAAPQRPRVTRPSRPPMQNSARASCPPTRPRAAAPQADVFTRPPYARGSLRGAMTGPQRRSKQQSFGLSGTARSVRAQRSCHLPRGKTQESSCIAKS
jgi:hypothetical protein